MRFRTAPATARTKALASTALAAFLAAVAPATAHAAADTAPAAATPADPAAPAAPDTYPTDPIRLLAGAMFTHSAGTERNEVPNPDGSTANVDLGGRYEVYAGAEFPVAKNGLAIRVTAGYQIANASSSEGSERFTRFPVEALLTYPLSSQLRIGAGVMCPIHLHFSGAGQGTSDSLGATPGAVLLVDYRVTSHIAIDLQYVNDELEPSGGGDVQANYFGIGIVGVY